MTAAEELEQLRAELARVNAEIDAAYWRFTRSARAAPPAVVCPGAYRRRAQLERQIADLRRAICPGSIEPSIAVARGSSAPDAG